MELLLLSNSTLPGKAWLEHALPLIAGQVKGRRKAVFIPFAGVTQSRDDYTAKVAAVMAPMAVSVTGIHSVDDPIAAIESTEMVIVGGGNTFQLLKSAAVAVCWRRLSMSSNAGRCISAGCRFKPCLPDHSHHQRYADCRSAGI